MLDRGPNASMAIRQPQAMTNPGVRQERGEGAPPARLLVFK